MADRPVIDFAHLSPAERLELAQQLWESIDAAQIEWTPTPGQCAELDRRLDDPDPGEPWEVVRAEVLLHLTTRDPTRP